ncbi:MAG: hypothetical protein HOQ32_07910 [Lysobacter sp.]|nr:hypothetical protein [Lysobacter sp.]
MQENPYSAPETSANELRDTPHRPASVKLAAAFIACSFLAGHAKFFFIDTPTAGVVTGIAFALAFGIAALFIAAILSRVAWARWVVAALLAVNASFLIFAIGHTSLSAIGIILVAQAVFQMAALVLLFLPPSVRWYRSKNSFQPKPLRGSAQLRR